MAVVHIRYFAVLRDRRRADGEEDFPLPEAGGPWTVTRIYRELFPPGDLPVAYAVNQAYVPGDHQPSDGDEVAFIPPVGGLMYQVVDAPIDREAVRAAVEDPGFGAILVFEGVARDNFEGRPVRALEYEAYPEMAAGVMAEIGAEIAARWPGARVAMVHRTGRLAIGEPSVIIATGTPHRAACYEASRYAIDQLKARVPVWKKEIYADGEAWKANPEAAEAGDDG